MYVSVVDQAGNPVTDLAAADFVVREDNLSRGVLRVSPADDPMQIAILVDNSTAAREHVINLRNALPEFVDALLKPTAGGMRNQISIIGLAERPTVLADSTFDRDQLSKAISRIWEQSMSGYYLLDATREVIQGFKKRDAARPVIVALTTDGPELSFTGYHAVLDAIAQSNTAFHVISLGRPSNSTDDFSIARNTVIDQGTVQSGGSHDRLLTSLALGTKLQQLANVLTHEYRVTYAHPDSLIPPEKITVSTRRPNLIARGRPVKQSAQGAQARP